MQLVHGIQALDAGLRSRLKSRSSVVTIGNFDGLHLGHRDLMQTLLVKAREIAAVSVVYTFYPHPTQVLCPDQPHFELFDRQDLYNELAAMGIDVVVCEPFNLKFSAQRPEEFFSQTLKEALQVKDLVVGYDFSFGSGKSGNLTTLEDLCLQQGVMFEKRQPVYAGSEKISSSAIRQHLEKGDVEKASVMLGRNYFVKGRVIEGEKRGRELGFPTANLQIPQSKFLRNGVYVAEVDLGVHKQNAVVNIGRAPTFHDEKSPVLFEAHLLDFVGDIYGREIRVDLLKFLRDEVKFSDLESLVSQIRSDIASTKNFFSKRVQ